MRRAIILLAFLTVACSSSLPSLKPYRMDVQQGNVINAKMMSQLRPGMTKSQVRFILGTPLIQDSFHKDRWDYFYQMRKAGTVVEQRRVILDFQNDLLKGVRGDVIAADSTPEGEAAKVAAAAPKAADSKVEEKKGFTDKLKFWKKDEPASQSVPAEGSQRAEVAVPAELLPATAAATTAAVVAEQSGPAVTPPAISAESSATAAAQAQAPSETLIAPAAATAAVAATPNDGPEAQAVSATLAAWTQAWSKKDAAAYLAFYSDKFVPDATAGRAAPSRKTWSAQRKQRLFQPGAVSVELEDVKIEATGNKATARFVQNYAAGSRVEHTDKVLQLENAGGKWLITREASQIAVNRPSDVQVKPIVQEAVAPVEMHASAPEPTAVPSSEDVGAVVTSRVQAWADAWRNKDVNTYLGFYAANFVPDTASSKKAWVAQRKQRLSRPGAVSLELEDIQVKADGDKATAEFVQRYRANGQSENVTKTLQLRKVSGSWLIIKETAGAALRKAPAGGVVEDAAPTPQLTPEQKSEYMPAPVPQPVPSQPKPAAVVPAPVPAASPVVSPAPAQAAPSVAAKPAPAATSSQEKLKEAEKNTPPEEQESGDAPGLFERMLEKIGF